MNLIFYFSGVVLLTLIVILLFPTKSSINSDISRINEKLQKFNRLEPMIILWMFLSVGLISFLVYYFGSQIRQNHFPLEYIYLIIPPDSYWIFPGVVLGFGLIRIPLTLIYKLIYKDDFDLYIQYSNIKFGYDGEKIWKPMERIITISGILIFLLGFNWYLRIDKKMTIEQNELFSLKTTTFNISEINEIYHFEKFITKDGNEKDIDHFVIEMKNGEFLSTDVFSFFANEKDKHELVQKIENLSHQVGIEIRNARQPNKRYN